MKVRNNISFNVINVMPANEGAFVLVTTFKNDINGMEFLETVEHSTDKDLELLLSNTLIHRIEDWCISPKLYRAQGKTIEAKVREFK